MELVTNDMAAVNNDSDSSDCASENQAPKIKNAVCNPQLVTHIASLFNDQETSDLILTCNDSTVSYYVHKTVLSQSPVFRSMLYGKGWQESGAANVHLNESGRYLCHIETFLGFIYGHPTRITWSNVEALVYFGDKYVVDILLDNCLKFFNKKAEKNGDLVCAISAWKMVRRVLVHRKMSLPAITELIFSNIERIMKNDDIIRSLDESDMHTILESNVLVCRTEFTIYKLLELWLLMKKESERFHLLKEFSGLLKTTYMHVQELSYVENSYKRLFPTPESEFASPCKDHLRLLLFDAYKFHVRSKDDQEEKTLVLPPPRLYLSLEACMNYQLRNINGLTTWAKMKEHFEVKKFLLKEGSTFTVTLMRKINASVEKHRTSLLSLEIRQLSCNPLGYNQGSIFVHENRSNVVLRKLLTRFAIPPGPVLTEINLEGVAFEDVLKKSVYQFVSKTAGQVYLALDVFLHK